DGTTTDWTFTTGSATALANAGITKVGPNALKIGEKLTVTFTPARNGSPLGGLKFIKRADGTVLGNRGGDYGPGPRPEISMISRERMTWRPVAVVATLMIGVPSVSNAQGRGNTPEYTPAPDAKDLKAVLFNWAWHMGMLRSTEEYD